MDRSWKSTYTNQWQSQVLSKVEGFIHYLYMLPLLVCARTQEDLTSLHVRTNLPVLLHIITT